jgi:hypothetical protein
MLTPPGGTHNILSTCDEPSKQPVDGPDSDEAPWPAVAPSDTQSPRQLREQAEVPECTWDDVVTPLSLTLPPSLSLSLGSSQNS